jgi:hypothetical protein
MDAAALEKIVRWKNPTIEQERAAASADRWPEYLRERTPPPSRLSFSRRAAWQAAYERALALGNSSEVREALVFDLWYCENPDDAASKAWTKVVAVSLDAGAGGEAGRGDGPDYELVERGTLGGRIVLARLERARRSFVLPSRFYAPQMELPYRNEHYAAVQSLTIERVLEVERVSEAPSSPRPTRVVPPFSTDTESAIMLDGVEPDWSQRILRLLEALRIFPDPPQPER